MLLPETVQVTLQVINVLENLHIPYFVVGSLASSFYGIPRATQDVDIVADLRFEHLPQFTEALENAFYIDENTVREAINRKGSFNIIQLDTMTKVDFFALKDDPIYQEELKRRRRYSITGEPGGELFLATPEDILLQKLLWFRAGGEVSDRQWEDVVGILKVQRESLDMKYVRKWASRLEIEDLLEKVLAGTE